MLDSKNSVKERRFLLKARKQHKWKAGILKLFDYSFIKQLQLDQSRWEIALPMIQSTK